MAEIRPEPKGGLIARKPVKAPRGLPKNLDELIGAQAKLKPGLKFPKKEYDEADALTFYSGPGTITKAEAAGASLVWPDGRGCFVRWSYLEIDGKTVRVTI